VRCEPWAETAPGALEIDTVALCGGSLSGAIVWALDASDIHSGWTEVRAVWNRGGRATCQRMSEIEQALPFGLRALDFDNGTEFLNAHFIGHFGGRESEVKLTRSRPYRKNDNAHIEQKNYTHVRLLLGDDRFDRHELVEPLNEVLKQWSLWNNLYCAQRRLVRKERGADGKVRRYHEKKASTPCARLLGHDAMDKVGRGRLKALLAANDPITVREEIENKLEKLYALRLLLSHEEEDLGSVANIVPGQGALATAGLGIVRPVAYGSLGSQRPNPPLRAKRKVPEEALPKRPNPEKTTPQQKPITVSCAVRHRAAA